MTHRNYARTTLAMILIAGFCLASMSSSAEAFGWRHHGSHFRYGHLHCRHHYAWPSYASFGYYPSYSFARYRAYYPVHYRYYTPSYYVTPYINYGCYSYPSYYGYGGFYSANTATDIPAPTAYARSSNYTIPKIMPNAVGTTMQVATSNQQVPRGKIELKINVPEDARVTINDRLTTTTGSERAYIVPGAQLNDQYEFVVSAEVERNGQTRTETKRVVARGGQVSSLAFDLDADSMEIAGTDQLVNTTVKLHVPDDAKVFLAGHEMKQTGAIRIFETTKLRAGEELANYTVRVVLAGTEEASREKQLTLVGGQSQEVEFDFEPSARLAAK